MSQTIYLLCDCTGEVQCAFESEEEAKSEALDSGCYVIETQLHGG